MTLPEAKALLKEDDDLIIAVYDYWLNKRLKFVSNQRFLYDSSSSERYSKHSLKNITQSIECIIESQLCFVKKSYLCS